MVPLRVVGGGNRWQRRAGHWPGHGPTDDQLTEIADNLSRARHSDRAAPQLFSAGCLLDLAPADRRKAHDMLAVIREIVDGAEFFAGWERKMICGLATFGGQVTGPGSRSSRARRMAAPISSSARAPQAGICHSPGPRAR
jgi:hypothetical protein